MTIDEIKVAMKDRRVAVVADATGLSRQTIYTLLKGENSKALRSTVMALSNYLERPL